ncbi:hypothetical protein R3X27_09340 [Tropicimonas sp. TH_r6]|uniref:hypothetical protein n=1 Tax=Tropicimonas sp. TH_r6 TaxID=3082085 RepID=UPI002955AA9A|nr:hypothetical protein [Tropicimonas sp. TH_r6]MDV7142888.1 hypothetical protein [Tropicimonas sp. TH_r6]
MKKTKAFALAAMAASSFAALPSLAQEPGFSLELNSVRPAEMGCRLTYVALNQTGTDLSAAAFEVAVFDAEGTVNTLLILDFGALKDGKTKVVQFDLAGQDCEGISRLLVNDAAECAVEEGEAPNCLEMLAPSSRTSVKFDF